MRSRAAWPPSSASFSASNSSSTTVVAPAARLPTTTWRSAPDGYTLLLGGLSSHALVEHLYSNLTFNPGTDLEVAAWIGTQPALLCCHPDDPHGTIAGLVAAATTNPGKIAYGAAGIGTSPTLAMEVFKQKAGINLTLISYRGSAAAAADVVAGHVPLVVATIDSLMGLVRGGKLKPVATTGQARSPATPDTPTFAETGFPDVVVTSWSLLAVPKGTPASIKQAILAATERAVQSADVIANTTAGGFEPGTKPVVEVEAFIKAERVRWGEVIRAAGIKPE
jgi:tripartite-type tricarboxylate transporter receptor subunit TctC